LVYPGERSHGTVAANPIEGEQPVTTRIGSYLHPQRLALGAALMTLAAALVLTPSAHAATTCTFNTDLLFIQMSEHEDGAFLELGPAGIILVNGSTGPVACGPAGPPTVTNTNAVAIVDESDDPGSPAPNDGETAAQIVDPAAFAPGATATNENGGLAEIEFAVNLEGGRDSLTLLAPFQGADDWAVGAGGINWNIAASDSAPDADLATFSGIEQWHFNLFADDDRVSAQGGSGTGGPFPFAVDIDGDDGNDVIEGADGADDLGGGTGDDRMSGFGGVDFFHDSAGDDTVDGGAGEDELNYFLMPTGVTVDLGLSSPQDTGGGGVDAISGIEDLYGSDHSDTLTGDGAFNYLWGNGGADTLDGGPGDDALTAGAGDDTLTYARAPNGVNVDLATGTTSGYGNDGIDGFENLTGSAFADVLIGNELANSITGLGGADTISALAGPDTVDVRDGTSDIASCGTELDSAIADAQGFDSVDPDCETVSFAAPETIKGKGPKRKLRKAKARFAFSSDSPAATFECKLDRRRFKPCSSPTKTKRLKRRRHTFAVRAVTAAGPVDLTPAVWKFNVVKKKRPR
jgi:Ca2+-binding RTX toxin-like protein